MKLYFAQREENREPFVDLFSEVSDDVIAWFLLLSAKRFITQKNFTMQDALDIMADLPGVPVDFGGDVQGPARDVEAIRAYFTKPQWSKPADVVIHDLIVDRPRNGLIVKWDYSEKHKERQKKRVERRDQKLKEELEAIRQKKGKKR